jgi:CubicO group peptidase (beta-lactamase class C family)
MVLVYSTSKGLAAMAIALAHSKGLIDYDELVAAYWPEFAQNGKERVTVRQLLGHEAGLCAIDERLSSRNLGEAEEVDRILAAQTPAWRPGTRHGYHALSIGWYESALIRRVDPEQRSLGRFFAEEIAAPLDLEFYFGLPSDLRRDRIAKIQPPDPFTLARELRHLPPKMAMAFANRRSLTSKVFSNPRFRSAATLDTARYRALEIPAGGGIGQVRSIARAYSDLATGGHEMGMADATLDELKQPAPAPSGGDMDLVLHVPTRFSLGYAKPSELAPFGTSEASFGHPGAGGSFAFADPDAEVSFAYAMNRMGLYLFDDPREKSLRDALYECVTARESTPAPSSTG